MKTFKNKVLASALALSLVGGAIIATPKTAEAESKPLYVKKVLTVPDEGVTTENLAFWFKFEAHSKNGDVDKAKDLPAIGGVEIKYSAKDKEDNDKTRDGKQLIKESEDVLKNVTWKEAGQFTYTVTEKAGDIEDMVYSKASYLVSIFVKKNEQGGYEVESIQIKQTTYDDGLKSDLNKTEYTPGDGTDPTKSKNKFEFENDYNKKGGNDNPGGGTDITDEDKKGFALRKTIEGNNPDPYAEFTFEFKLEKPAGSSAKDDQYSFHIVNNQGQAGEKKYGYYGNTYSENLKHNERIVFGKVLLGSTVTVDETDAGAYVGSVISTFNGTSGTSKTGVIGDRPNGNCAEYKNTKQTPTGLLIDNLPFLALVLVAGAGIIFFVKNKKEEELA